MGASDPSSDVACAEAPVLQGEAFSYLVEPVGGSVRLDCAVRGDPAPDLLWIKDGLPLRGGRPRLRLQNGSLAIRRTEVRRGLAPWVGAPGAPWASPSCSGGFFRPAPPSAVCTALACPLAGDSPPMDWGDL